MPRHKPTHTHTPCLEAVLLRGRLKVYARVIVGLYQQPGAPSITNVLCHSFALRRDPQRVQLIVISASPVTELSTPQTGPRSVQAEPCQLVGVRHALSFLSGHHKVEADARRAPPPPRVHQQGRKGLAKFAAAAEGSHAARLAEGDAAKLGTT
jgi:hypothetical protein